MLPSLQMQEFRKYVEEYSRGKLSIVQLHQVSAAASISWLEELRASGVDTEAQWPLITNILDKLITAHATVFLSTPASHFSADIQRLRYGMLLASCNDTYICQGEPEWHTPYSVPT